MTVVMSNNFFAGNAGSNSGGAVSFAGVSAKGSSASNFTSVSNVFTQNQVTRQNYSSDPFTRRGGHRLPGAITWCPCVEHDLITG